jgi:PAS domain-containing protein
MSTPAVAKRVHALEDLTQRRLLNATARGVQATEIAEEALPHARDVLRRIDELSGLLGASAVHEDWEALSHVRGAVLDTPSERSAERALRDAEQLIALLFRVGPAAVALTRPADNYVYLATDGFCELLGSSRHELEGSFLAHGGPWEPAAAGPARDALNDELSLQEGDVEISRPDGAKVRAVARCCAFRVASEPRLVTALTPRRDGEH